MKFSSATLWALDMIGYCLAVLAYYYWTTKYITPRFKSMVMREFGGQLILLGLSSVVIMIKLLFQK